jgi:hypothetical protein
MGNSIPSRTLAIKTPHTAPRDLIKSIINANLLYGYKEIVNVRLRIGCQEIKGSG